MPIGGVRVSCSRLPVDYSLLRCQRPAKKTVLVVEDEKLIRWSLAQNLALWGYDPIEAGDAASAAESALRRPPDLVLLDLRLPDRNGIELLRQLRSEHPSMRVIMMTAHGSPEDALAAMHSGALRFLLKPLNMEELRGIVRDALASEDPGPRREH